jgi:hypothetical protein
MPIDELEAFKAATDLAHARRWPWQPPYWIDLVDDEWEVQAEGAYVIRLNSASGKAVAEQPLDPLVAFERAKLHVQEKGMPWTPGFSLQLDKACWLVGARQSQLGGNITVKVDQHGSIVNVHVNPK